MTNKFVRSIARIVFLLALILMLTWVLVVRPSFMSKVNDIALLNIAEDDLKETVIAGSKMLPSNIHKLIIHQI